MKFQFFTFQLRMITPKTKKKFRYENKNFVNRRRAASQFVK